MNISFRVFMFPLVSNGLRTVQGMFLKAVKVTRENLNVKEEQTGSTPVNLKFPI